MTAPDTSSSNVQRILERARSFCLYSGHAMKISKEAQEVSIELAALADALNARPVVTWDERVGRGADAVARITCHIPDGVPVEGWHRTPRALEVSATVLRAAFPEAAPQPPHQPPKGAFTVPTRTPGI